MQIDYFGNKVLSEQIAANTEWYKCYRHTLCGATLNFIKEKFEQGNPFDNKGDDFDKNFKKLIGGAEAPAETPKRAEEEKKAIKP